MTTSQTTRLLSKPKTGERISPNALAYLRMRTRLRIFDLVIKNFRASKITQAELAKRLGKGTDRICKLLGSPGNWTSDTASDLLFAIDGCVLEPHGSYPLDRLIRNDTRPHYLEIDSNKPSIAASTSGLITISPPNGSQATITEASGTITTGKIRRMELAL